MMKSSGFSFCLLFVMACAEKRDLIDREALVRRHNGQLTAFDAFASVSVGNADLP
jgi:hypothetical protein